MFGSKGATSALGASQAGSAIAVRDQQIAFVAKGDVLLTGTSPFKSLKKVDFPLAIPSRVQNLVLNEADVFLAIIGKESVVVADLSLVKAGDAEYDKKIQTYALKSFDSPVLTALWHPASSTKTHLVVLTETSIALFDVAISCLEPQFELSIKGFPQLKDQKVVSMAFGSSHNYIGSSTLYISTREGNIYGISPLIYDGFPQSISGDMLADFLAESKEVAAMCEEKIPPASTFNPFRESLADYTRLAENAEDIFINLHIGEFPGSKIWNFRVTGAVSPRLVGPIAELGSECKLTTVTSTLEFTTLCAVSKSSNDEVNVSYLAQLHPFIYGFEPASNLLAKPTKPVPSAPVLLTESYVKPRRGFGFSVVPSNEDITSEVQLKEQEDYKRALSEYQAQRSISLFLDSNFNLLSIVSSDLLGVKSESLSRIGVQCQGDWLVIQTADSIISSNLSKALNLIMDPSTKTFNGEYMENESSLTSFAIFDSSSTSELKILANTNGNSLSILNLKLKVDPQLPLTNSSSYELETRGKGRPEKFTLPSKELKEILKRTWGIPNLKSVDTESSESLKQIHDTSIAAVKRIRDLTGFILTLQSTLAIQHCELNFQRCGLEECQSKDISSPIDNALLRYKKCTERQAKLSEKCKSLHQRILSSFQESKKKANLPLSDAERAWFKELNAITTKIGVDKEDEQSLQLIVGNLSKRVDALLKDEGTNDVLNNHALDKSWTKVNFLLKRQGSVIERTKSILEDLLLRVSDVNVGIPV